jgi:hypothetical protein
MHAAFGADMNTNRTFARHNGIVKELFAHWNLFTADIAECDPVFNHFETLSSNAIQANRQLALGGSICVKVQLMAFDEVCRRFLAPL